MELTEIQALMLRAVAREIRDNMAPDLRYPNSSERAGFAEYALEFVAAHLDLLPAIADEGRAALRGAFETVFAALPDNEPFHALAPLRRRYETIPHARRAQSQEIADLRTLGADMIRALSDLPLAPLGAIEKTVIARSVEAIGAADRAWLSLFAAAQQARALQTPSKTPNSSTPLGESVTPAALTAYLRRYFPSSSLRVRDLHLISGGRSKRTLRLDLEESGTLPEVLVMRQDMPLKHVGSRIQDEYEPLVKLHARGLPVPQVLHYEPAETELGQAFLLLPFLEGAPPGDYFGLKKKCPGAYRELARALALLHRSEPAAIGLSAPDRGRDPLLAHIETQWAIWRTSLRPSPAIDHAFAFAVRECRETIGTWSVVHGDCGPHNLLVEQDRLVALIDWEFAHAGDPAEDLGITRLYAEETLDWAEFMEVYRAAGGPDIPDRRIRVGMLSHYLKGAALSAMSNKNFAEGGTSDYIKGMISFTGLPQIEMKIVELLARAG